MRCLPLMLVLSGCGGGGGAGSAAPVLAASAAVPYAETIVLGNLTPAPVGLLAAQGAGGAQIVSATASTLLAAGQTPMVASHAASSAAGALVACVSAPTTSTGSVDGINLGVNIKSVAALMDASWSEASDSAAAWASLAQKKTLFEGWENCGAKPEGLPSPASLRTLNADGSFVEDIYDGNPSTNLNIITLHADATQVARMLSSAGYLNTTQSNAAQRVWLRLYRNQLAQTILIEQGLPETGATARAPGYLAVYFVRQAL